VKTIGVDCSFNDDGLVQIRRIQYDREWKHVSQGRQWLDSIGRHVLVMLPDGKVKEICLRADTLTWGMAVAADGTKPVV
jgi:hypothetical protein